MPPLPQNHTLRAGLYMVVAMTCFILNDSCVKTIGTSLPIGEIIGIRGTLSVLVIAAICAQHECDHLDGILTLDHLSPQARSVAIAQATG